MTLSSNTTGKNLVKLPIILLIPPCLDTFEGERIEWQQEAEKLRIVLERIHSQESELVGKKHEIAEIQKIISDARLAVHDER